MPSAAAETTTAATAQLQWTQCGGLFRTTHVPTPALAPDEVRTRSRFIALGVIDLCRDARAR
ncbi:hypothetical protein MMC27_001411 [Xylographa pallens]|nr:hypothetical protein [Xylographa pallens]